MSRWDTSLKGAEQAAADLRSEGIKAAAVGLDVTRPALVEAAVRFAFPLSDRASFVAGSCHLVDGGYTAVQLPCRVRQSRQSTQK
ncbi:hypothetical protein [Streptomyces sp. NPDC048256]|uniref:hypothetical protein n=1 Tax=Streptomyces sp. NPDC048256 TaxID=3154613 RepID=UPI0033EE0B28